MAFTRTYVRCPYCKNRFSSSEDETHKDGCPRPSERRLSELQMLQIVNDCPDCDGEVLVNKGDVSECVNCGSQWIPSWTQGRDAISASTVTFRLHGESMPMTRLPEKGAGLFPRRDEIEKLAAEVADMKAKFKP